MKTGDCQASSWELLLISQSPLTALSVSVNRSWANHGQHLPLEVQNDWQSAVPRSANSVQPWQVTRCIQIET